MPESDDPFIEAAAAIPPEDIEIAIALGPMGVRALVANVLRLYSECVEHELLDAVDKFRQEIAGNN